MLATHASISPPAPAFSMVYRPRLNDTVGPGGSPLVELVPPAPRIREQQRDVEDGHRVLDCAVDSLAVDPPLLDPGRPFDDLDREQEAVLGGGDKSGRVARMAAVETQTQSFAVDELA